jgi:hypothetical protein
MAAKKKAGKKKSSVRMKHAKVAKKVSKPAKKKVIKRKKSATKKVVRRGTKGLPSGWLGGARTAASAPAGDDDNGGSGDTPI